MGIEIEAASAEKPLEAAGHDRILLDKNNNLYGIFDGAGTAMASDFVLEAIKSYSTREEMSPADMLTEAQSELLEWLDKIIRNITHIEPSKLRNITLTTASLVKIIQDGKGVRCAYAATGDSPIYSYNRSSGLNVVAEDETEKLWPEKLEIANFLGSTDHELTKYGEFEIQSGGSIVIMSDGVCNKRPAGIDNEALSKILENSYSATETAAAILKESNITDDKSVVVIRAGLKK